VKRFFYTSLADQLGAQGPLSSSAQGEAINDTNSEDVVCGGATMS